MINSVCGGLLSLLLLLSSSCSEAQSHKGGKKDDKEDSRKASALNPIAGLTKTGTMPKKVRESSGLALGPEPGTYYTHGDDGSDPELYLVRDNGELVRTIGVPGVKHQDWESLAQDPQGNLYIGDCGNNNNDRRDLTIYRFDPSRPTEPRAIRFNYPDQKEYPPKKKERNFDCEAMIWHSGSLYLFTRDRGQDETCKIYRLDANGPAKQTATPMGKLKLPGVVTDANLSPNGKLLALLGREELYLCEVQGTDFAGAKVRTVKLPGAGQTEGVVFKTNNTLVITTEQGAVYQYVLD